MRDDEIRSILREVNPWWAAKLRGCPPTAWAASDPSLRDRQRWDMGYRTTVFDDVATEPLTNGLYVLRGPRRVGKSVALKDLLVALLDRADVHPLQVIYFTADTLTSQALRRYFAVGRNLTTGVGDRPRVWVIDEITAVGGWTNLLKELRDTTPVTGDCVVVTGSSAADTKEAVRDLGAGRTGKAQRPFRHLLPMPFASFVRLVQPDLQLPSRLAPSDLCTSEARAIYETWSLVSGELDRLWQDYLETGGFPRAVAEHHHEGGVSRLFLDDLAAWLRTDIDPSAPAESVDLLIDRIVYRTATPLNLRRAAEELGVSRSSLELRLTRMLNSYAALWCPQMQDGRTVQSAQAKLYLTDPLLEQLPTFRRPGLNPPDMSRQTEAGLAITLARSIDASCPGRWEDGDTIGYHRTGGGGEVDFAPVSVIGPTGPVRSVPIEVKWTTQGWRRDAHTLIGSLGQGIVATKDVTDLSIDEAWAVPAPLLALVLDPAGS